MSGRSALLLLLVFLGAILPKPIYAQVTHALIQGTVLDESEAPLAGANVVAIHEPSGTWYGTATQADGRYTLPNLQPGGPYTLSVSFIGYDTQQETQLFVQLSTTSIFEFQLTPSDITLGEIVIAYDNAALFDADRKGVASNVNQEQIERLPSLNRSLQDMTRITPQGNTNVFAGTNYRFNHLSIDGAAHNDVLGFQEPASGAGGTVASGTPGALANAQPISLDAIAEVQVAIAPFDVRLGNFTGANLNAVTRRGSNQIEGAAYAFGRNENLAGKDINGNALESFHDYSSGFRIGGPLIRNKLFAFANYELSRRAEPVLAVPGSAGSNIPIDVVTAISDTLESRLGYNPGAFGRLTNNRINDKLFVRFDYNLGKNHKLSLRHNLVDASADNLSRSEGVFKYSSQSFNHQSRTNSTVAEWKATFGNRASNHMIVGYNNVEDNREFDGDVFPHVEINYNTSNQIFLGTYREASVYGLSVGSVQFTNNYSLYRGKHTITIGTSNEFHRLQYRFLTAWNGRWAYRSVDDFFADSPSRVRGAYNLLNNDFNFNRNRPSADLRVFLLSGYIQDEIRVSERLALTIGARLDMQVQPDQVPINPEVQNTPAFAGFDNDFGGAPQINPRVGFNYALREDRSMQLRGGLGLFTGRIPFVWNAYAHYVSGLEYGNVDIRPDGDFPLERDISALSDLQPGLTEINLVDNDFKLPRVARLSLAYDVKLPAQTSLTLEGVFSKSLDAIQFQSINLNPATATFNGADQRLYYTSSGEERKINPNFTNVFLLTNTDKGYQYNLTAQLRTQFSANVAMTTAYTYGESKDVSNGVRNSMAANFNWNQSVFSNDPGLAYSNFDLRHRVLATVDARKLWKAGHETYASFLINAQSGSPFSFTYSGDLNRDGSSRNDLIFVPGDASEINLLPYEDALGNTVDAATQWANLDAYISNNDYLDSRRGTYAERNGSRTPWNFQIDMRLAHRIEIKSRRTQSVELSLDIFNLGDLIHERLGRQTFVPNETNASFQLLEFETIEDGTPYFQFKNPTGTPWQIDPLASRWQAQFGVRYSF
ncbi:MAG: carboxypeptidase regulatory-like domain-containing protein [Bacteroidota bacterium]